MTHALSALTRQHVTVALSGDGGDELFCGYPRFVDTDDRHPRRHWQSVLRDMVDAGLVPASLLRRSLWGQELLLYRHVELGPWPGRKNMAQYLAPQTATAAHPEETLSLWRQLIAELGGRMDTATLMRADLWTYLSENCLVKTDRASMAHSLEVRVPMLGQPVQDAVLSLPAAVHTAGGSKSLLLEIARRSLPDTVWDRPKHGFSVPLLAYFNGQWREVCDNCVDRCAELAPFLNAAAVRQLWTAAKAGKASRRLAYTFVVLLIWLDRHLLEL
jgi:asparagine synthase (glutamine-hydrolysing)